MLFLAPLAITVVNTTLLCVQQWTDFLIYANICANVNGASRWDGGVAFAVQHVFTKGTCRHGVPMPAAA